MKKSSMRVLTGIFIALLAEGLVFAQSAPSPQEKEDQKEMGVYSEELDAANQDTVEAKNKELAAAAAADTAIPAVSAPDTTTANGTIVLTFQGTLLPADLSQLWARVTYNGKTEYWKLDPAMIASDGKSFSMQFNPSFNGTTFQMSLYGFSAGTNEQTNFSNTVTFKINVPSTVTMPASTAPAQTNEAGRITLTFAQPILPDQLGALWAKISYDGKTEYWKLAPGMIAPDGKTFSMKFDPKFNGKQVTMELYGYAAGDGSQTNYSNAVTFTVASSGSLTMPSATVPAETDLNGKITATFSSPMLPSQLSDLWAIVSYDGKTEYWDLDASMISSDGRTFSMVFDSQFNNKQITMQLYGYSASTGAQTTVGNQLTFKVTPSTSTVTMPTVQSTGNTDPTGKIVVAFTSGTLVAGQIRDLWARVTYDGNTYYWDLDPGMLAADGRSLTMEFGSEFDGKTVTMEFYAFDANNVQTGFSNPIAITVHSSAQGLTMPVIPSTGTTDNQGKIVIPFNEGTLLAGQIRDLWAEVTYDGKTYYWDLDPGMLAADGKSLTMEFGSDLDGKTVSVKFYAFDVNNVQTGFTNPIAITVHANPQNITMPVIPSTGTTDNQGKIVIPFSNGTLVASQIRDLWAQVTYDGKTYYWDLDPGMLAADGRSLTMEFTPDFDGKTVTMQFYAFDANNVQTGFTNPIAITVHASAQAVTMPVIPSTGTTDNQGKIVIPFSSGTLNASQIRDLWARVTYDGRTLYWDLDPAMIAADGHSLTMEFTPDLNGKTVTMEFYAFDANNVQTGFTNPIAITVHALTTGLTIPQIPSAGTTDVNGKISIAFSNGTLLASQISDLWAQVTYDNATYYWDLNPGMLSADGRSISMEFGPEFHNKTVQMRFYAFDTNNVQTGMSNLIAIAVNNPPALVTMPVLPATATLDSTGYVRIDFTGGGRLYPGQLNDFWAEVTYDNKTEYWDLDPAMIAADGTYLSMTFNSEFIAKRLRIRFFGFDRQGKQTAFTNAIIIN